MCVERYFVVLRHNPSGETIRIEMDRFDAPMGAIEFLWEEGNYGCDCNRHLFWERAHGREPSMGEMPCSDAVVYDLIEGPTMLIEGEQLERAKRE